MKRFFAALMVLSIMLSLCACSAAEKVFTCGDLSITLTSAFKESSADGMDAYFESRKAGVTVLEDEKALIAGGDTLTKKDYAELVIETHNKTPLGSVGEIGGLTSFTFVSTVDGDSFTYDVYIFETTKSFWMVQFFCFTDDYGKYVNTFRTWAQSVVIDDNTETDPTQGATTADPTETQEKGKTFTVNNVSITLTEDFEQTEIEGQDGAFLSDKAAFTFLAQTREELTGLGYEGATMTAKDYADTIISNSTQQTSEVKEENGIVSYSYDATTTNYEFSYQVYVLENNDTFYLMQFYCLKSDFAAQSPNFAKWIKTVSFS